MDLITRGLAEVIGEDEIKSKLEEKRGLSAYWGTEPTGCPSLGYYVPMLKIRDLINAGVNVTILIADVHAFLNKGPSEYDRTHERSIFYMMYIHCFSSTYFTFNKISYVVT